MKHAIKHWYLVVIGALCSNYLRMKAPFCHWPGLEIIIIHELRGYNGIWYIYSLSNILHSAQEQAADLPL
jgi:hypothetical protein